MNERERFGKCSSNRFLRKTKKSNAKSQVAFFGRQPRLSQSGSLEIQRLAHEVAEISAGMYWSKRVWEESGRAPPSRTASQRAIRRQVCTARLLSLGRRGVHFAAASLRRELVLGVLSVGPLRAAVLVEEVAASSAAWVFPMRFAIAGTMPIVSASLAGSVILVITYATAKVPTAAQRDAMKKRGGDKKQRLSWGGAAYAHSTHLEDARGCNSAGK